MRIDKLTPGERVVILVKGIPYERGEFLGVTLPDGNRADATFAKMKWAEFYSRLLETKVKPTFKDIYLAYWDARDENLVPYGHLPRIDIKRDDGSKFYLYYNPKNGWMIGSGALRASIEPIK